MSTLLYPVKKESASERLFHDDVMCAVMLSAANTATCVSAAALYLVCTGIWPIFPLSPFVCACVGLTVCQGRNPVFWHMIGMGTAPEIHSIRFQDHSLQVNQGFRLKTLTAN